jgi:hypothetical protein
MGIACFIIENVLLAFHIYIFIFKNHHRYRYLLLFFFFFNQYFHLFIVFKFWKIPRALYHRKPCNYFIKKSKSSKWLSSRLVMIFLIRICSFYCLSFHIVSCGKFCLRIWSSVTQYKSICASVDIVLQYYLLQNCIITPSWKLK